MESSSRSDRGQIAVTADVALLIGPPDARKVLLVVRGSDPFRGHLALPGGFVERDEDLSTAAARELHEETGVSVESTGLTQLGAYGEPGRDPRMRVISVVFYAVVDEIDPPTAGDDASDAMLVPLASALSAQLAFDHHTILTDLVEAVA